MSATRRPPAGPTTAALALLASLLAVALVAGCTTRVAGSSGPSLGPLPLPSSGTGGTAASSPGPTPSRPKPTPKPTKSKPRPTTHAASEVFVFPVVGKVGYAHTHHDYPATDIIAACGDEVRAVTNGVVLEVTRVDTWNPKVNAGATRGGLSVSIRGDDGVRYYGSHLEQINSNIKPGVRVKAGQALGKVGQTGDASVCHLHFGISPVCRGTGDWWIQRGVVWPWSYLDSWRAGGRKSPVAAVAAWHQRYGCPSHPLTDP